MEIKLNTEARDQRINQQVNKYYLEALDKIAGYAENGFDLSEHIFPNEIYEQVRTKLGDHMQAFNIKFVWQSIGNMNSVAVGEGRLMRFKLLS
jgi:hypothetical protein